MILNVPNHGHVPVPVRADGHVPVPIHEWQQFLVLVPSSQFLLTGLFYTTMLDGVDSTSRKLEIKREILLLPAEQNSETQRSQSGADWRTGCTDDLIIFEGQYAPNALIQQ